MKYSSDQKSSLNTARWKYKLARTMIIYANKGFGDIRSAMRLMSKARVELLREMISVREALAQRQEMVA